MERRATSFWDIEGSMGSGLISAGQIRAKTLTDGYAVSANIGRLWLSFPGDYKRSNLTGYKVLGGFWVDFFHKKPPIQP